MGGLVGLLVTLASSAGRVDRPHGEAILMARDGRDRDRRRHRPVAGDQRGRDGRRLVHDRLRASRDRQDRPAGRTRLPGCDQSLPERPGRGPPLNGLRRVGSVEMLIAATVLLLSASLVNLAPPVDAAAAAATPSPSPSPAPLVVDRQRLRHVGPVRPGGLARDCRVQHLHGDRHRLRQRRTGRRRRRHASLLVPGPIGCRELAARPRADGTPGVFSATGDEPLARRDSGRSPRRSLAERLRSRSAR